MCGSRLYVCSRHVCKGYDLKSAHIWRAQHPVLHRTSLQLSKCHRRLLQGCHTIVQVKRVCECSLPCCRRQAITYHMQRPHRHCSCPVPKTEKCWSCNCCHCIMPRAVDSLYYGSAVLKNFSGRHICTANGCLTC